MSGMMADAFRVMGDREFQPLEHALDDTSKEAPETKFITAMRKIAQVFSPLHDDCGNK